MAVAATGCHHESSRPTFEDNPSAAECANVVLRPRDEGSSVEAGVAPGALPAIGIDTRRLQGVARVTVELTRCAGEPLASLTHQGPGSFVLDASWYRSGQPPGCHRLVATGWSRGGAALGIANARIRQGNNTVSGQVSAGSGAAPVRARVRLLVDDVAFEVDTDDAGGFSIDHLPAGTLRRASARELVRGLELPRLGDVAPLVALGDAHPTATLTIPLFAGAAPLDAFEPDDTLEQASKRGALAAGTAELHALPTRSDVDVIPFDAEAGRRYRAELAPTGPRAPDVALETLDSAGGVLDRANLSAADFSSAPSLGFSFASARRVFLRVTRNDDESSQGRYAIRVAPFTGSAP